MKITSFQKSLALSAAVATTLALFSSVVKLAENDRKALAAARSAPVQLSAAHVGA